MSDLALAPTPERLARSNHWEQPGAGERTVIKGTATNVVRVKRAAYRHVSLVEMMYDSGELRHEQASAYQQFSANWEFSERTPFPQSRYGMVTPSNDQERIDRHGRAICPVANRVSARDQHRKTIRTLGPNHTRVLYHIMLERASRLSVGKDVLGFRDKHTASKRGKEAVQAALEALAQHYGLLKTVPRPPAA